MASGMWRGRKRRTGGERRSERPYRHCWALVVPCTPPTLMSSMCLRPRLRLLLRLPHVPAQHVPAAPSLMQL